MNVLERSQEFAAGMVELNKSAFTGHYGIQKESVVSAIEANRTRFAALREASNLNGVIDAQRGFYSAMQKNVSSLVREQFTFAKENVGNASELLKQFVNTNASMAEDIQDSFEDTVDTAVETMSKVKGEIKESTKKTAAAVEQAVKASKK